MCAFGWYCIINRCFAADSNRVAALSRHSSRVENVMAMTSVGLFREPWMLTDILYPAASVGGSVTAS